MNLRFYAIALLASIFSGFLNAQETLKLVNDPWPPYTFQHPANKGVATNIVQSTLNRAGYKSTVTLVPWERALKGTMIGIYDILMTTSYSAERAKKVIYSEPYLENTIKFLKLKSSPYKYSTLPGFKGLRIGTISGYLYSKEFDEASFLQKDSGATNMIANLKKLKLGRLDLIIGDVKTIKYYINKDFNPTDFEFLPQAVNSKSMHIIIRKEHLDAEKIISDFNRALKEIKIDGTHEKILSSYKEYPIVIL